ncbi:MAG: YwqG family protein [Ktedonobacteraceae bacterium]
MSSDITSLLQDAKLTRIASQIEQLPLPSIRLKSRRVQEASLPLGVSKIGGLPDLPPDPLWPIWHDTPLAFIAQINFAEIQAMYGVQDLPEAGICYFFYDADHGPIGYDPHLRGGWRVFYYGGIPMYLRRVPAPTALREKKLTWLPEEQHYQACALTFSTEMTLPPCDSSPIDALRLSAQERASYQDVLEKMEKRASGPLHRLLGHPDALQGDMQTECQLVSHGLYFGNGWPDEKERVEQLLKGAQDWQLLLQLDTDPEAEMLWGIEGRCYYWIQTQALQARNFENVWFIMQWT